MKVKLTRDNGTTIEVETTNALVIYQEGDEIAVMGDCNAFFIQLVEAADIIGQAAQKQTAALAENQKPLNVIKEAGARLADKLRQEEGKPRGIITKPGVSVAGVAHNCGHIPIGLCRDCRAEARAYRALQEGAWNPEPDPSVPTTEEEAYDTNAESCTCTTDCCGSRHLPDGQLCRMEAETEVYEP